MAIEFSGSVGQLQSAFHTSLHSYCSTRAALGQRYRSTDPQRPGSRRRRLRLLNNFKPGRSMFRTGGVFDPQTQTIRPATPIRIVTATTTSTRPRTRPPSTTRHHAQRELLRHGLGRYRRHHRSSRRLQHRRNQNANYRSTFGLAPNPVTVVVDGNGPRRNPTPSRHISTPGLFRHSPTPR